MPSVKDRLKDCQAAYAALMLERQTWEPLWINLSRFFCPTRSKFLVTTADSSNANDANRGDQNQPDLFDETAVLAANNLAAGMHGGLTSPARPWFALAMEDMAATKDAGDMQALAQNQVIMENAYAQSNFYTSMESIYQELAVFGTGFMFVHPIWTDKGLRLHFKPLTVGEYALDTDFEGQVDTVAHQMSMTAKAILGRWGKEVVSESVYKAATDPANRYTRFKVIHMVYPRDEYDPEKLDSSNKRFASVWYEAGQTDKFLEESGYDLFPGVAARWSQVGQDVYGRSPAMLVLNTVRGLQQIESSLLLALHKQVEPPVVLPADLDSPNLLPNGINYVRDGSSQGQAAYPLYLVKPDVQATFAKQEQIRTIVQNAMYTDLFRMITMTSRANRTATEVAELQEEKLMMLGPVLERMHAEFFNPLTDLVYAYLKEAGLTVPFPQEMMGDSSVRIKVDYVSMLAKAQKAVNTASLDRYTAFMMNNSGLYPELGDNVDSDKMARSYADCLGASVTEVLRAEDEVAKIREARAKQQQQMQQQQQIAEIAKLNPTTASAGGGLMSQLQVGAM